MSKHTPIYSSFNENTYNPCF